MASSSAQYEQNATSQLKLFDLDGKSSPTLRCQAIGSVFAFGGKWNRDEVFFGFQSFTVPPILIVPHIDCEARPTNSRTLDEG